jgi:hypothetical protein
VGNEHVEHRPGGVVEGGTLRDVEHFGDVDLHLSHVRAVPYPAEQTVAEPHRVEILGGLLAEKVVDPEHLGLIEHLMNRAVECMEGGQRCAERFLEDHPRPRGEPMPAQATSEGLKRRGRHGEVVHPLGASAQLAFRFAEDLEKAPRVVRGEAAAGEAQPRAELLPRALIGLRAELGQRVVHAGPEVVVAHVATAVADQPPIVRQQLLLRQAEQRREHHPASEIAGSAVEHENGGVGHAAKLRHGTASLTMVRQPAHRPGPETHAA